MTNKLYVNHFDEPKVNTVYKNMVYIQPKEFQLFTDKEFGDEYRSVKPKDRTVEFEDLPKDKTAMVNGFKVKYYENPLIHGYAVGGISFSYTKFYDGIVFLTDKDQALYTKHTRRRNNGLKPFPATIINCMWKGNNKYIELDHTLLRDKSVDDIEKLSYLADEAGSWLNVGIRNMDSWGELRLNMDITSIDGIAEYIRNKHGVIL